MAPKKGRKVVKTTTKVIQETVEVVSVIGSQETQDQTQDQTQAQPEVIEHMEEHTSTITKSIPIEDKEDDETETQGPDFLLEEPKVDKIATPPREEAPPRQGEEEAQDQARPNERIKKESPSAQEVKEKATTTTKTGRKRGKRRMSGGMGEGEGYKRYVFRVLKQVHPGMAITSGAMMVINNFMTDMFERLAEEASKLNTYSKKQTMSAREIQGAVQLVLPGELGKHAVAEGSKAVTNYVTYGSKK